MHQDSHMQVENLNFFWKDMTLAPTTASESDGQTSASEHAGRKLKAERYGASFRWSFLQEDYSELQISLRISLKKKKDWAEIFLKDYERSLWNLTLLSLDRIEM